MINAVSVFGGGFVIIGLIIIIYDAFTHKRVRQH